MNILMVGAGYVGLVSGACFAEFGCNVTCVDTNKDKIGDLINGKIPIYEPGLEELVKNNLKKGTLKFESNLTKALSSSEIIFIAVGTPARRGDGHADLKYVYEVAREIGQNLNGYKLIVNKSTVPVGTAREVKRIIKKVNKNALFDIASNPEFLREGSAIDDFMNPDRIIIGVDSDSAEEKLKKLYSKLTDKGAPILSTNLESSELIKYASNAFLATKISFINEISHLSEITGGDITQISKGMGLDKRIGDQFLNAGPGYGGSCFPKDTLALIRICQESGSPSRIIEAVVEVNAAQKARMVKKIRQSLDGSEDNKKIAIFGLTFKPGTDDMRDAPSLSVIPPLIDKGAIINAHDPEGIKEASGLLPHEINFYSNIYESISNVDAIVLMTEWEDYRNLDFEKILTMMKGNTLIDLRNFYNPRKMKEIGFNYHSVGR